MTSSHHFISYYSIVYLDVNEVQLGTIATIAVLMTGEIATTFPCRRPLLPSIISVQSRGTKLFSRSRFARSQGRPVKRLVVAPMLIET